MVVAVAVNKIATRFSPCLETLYRVAFLTFYMAMYRLCCCKVVHAFASHLHLARENCFLAVQKHLFIEEFYLLMKRHSYHETATAYLVAVVAFLVVVNEIICVALFLFAEDLFYPSK